MDALSYMDNNALNGLGFSMQLPRIKKKARDCSTCSQAAVVHAPWQTTLRTEDTLKSIVGRCVGHLRMRGKVEGGHTQPLSLPVPVVRRGRKVDGKGDRSLSISQSSNCSSVNLFN